MALGTSLIQALGHVRKQMRLPLRDPRPK